MPDNDALAARLADLWHMAKQLAAYPEEEVHTALQEMFSHQPRYLDSGGDLLSQLQTDGIKYGISDMLRVARRYT